MGEHRIEFVQSRARPAPVLSEWAQCKCGQNSGWCATRKETEVWAEAHRQSVERVRMALSRSRNVGLKDQYEWFKEQADNPENPPREREQWLALAQEVEKRLGESAMSGQDALFDLP